MTAIELRTELFREMSPLLDNESAMTKMLAFVKSLVPAKKAKMESDWANRFVGAWKDSRSAEEIISDIWTVPERTALIPFCVSISLPAVKSEEKKKKQIAIYDLLTQTDIF